MPFFGCGHAYLTCINEIYNEDIFDQYDKNKRKTVGKGPSKTYSNLYNVDIFDQYDKTRRKTVGKGTSKTQ